MPRGNDVRSAYNHAEYLPERRMLQEWADYLDKLRDNSVHEVSAG